MTNKATHVISQTMNHQQEKKTNRKPSRYTNHVKVLKLSVKPFNSGKLLNITQAALKINRTQDFIRSAMRRGLIDFFYIRTPGKDYFFITDNEKLEKLGVYEDGKYFNYKLFLKKL